VGVVAVRSRDFVFVEKNRPAVRSTTRGGQDKLAEIQNILHETITGNRIVKAFGMENWEMERFRAAARRLFRANLRLVAAFAISSPLMDILGSIAVALLLLMGRDQINKHFYSGLSAVYFCGFQALRPGAQVRACSTTISSRRWEPRRKFSVSWIWKTKCGRSRERSAWGNLRGRSGLRTCLFPIPKTPRIRRWCCTASIWK
jgi:ABC-type multidrug transport system fused ATPase/permease subunit